MTEDLEHIKAILTEALEKETEAERRVYLDEVCGTDTNLQAEVESLLRSHDHVGDFLDVSPFGPDITLDTSPLIEVPGTVIDRYKLLQKIGEGGMAVVYMAEQQEPIRRKVALKVIKLGMDTKQVIARFEAERQALATMDHPNIAKVFDAGATETGRPYFVMELVHGILITEYCDNNQLDMHRRLELFVQVCQAVQHAHQKGIIHRDIKPSNVLVTMHDDKPVPKVIDFGIAKATNQRLTEKTVFTQYAHFIGTPAYMSPEQAQMSGLDVDTRTDAYSLGVLLYELLTGTTPFDANRLREAGYTEIQRIICETDPLKPSTKLNRLGQTLIDIAQYRQANPESLRKRVKGDLDWIVMKCLEKDRTRRYETAHGLAEDIERHLKNEPILARSPDIMYRAQKFWRRHRSYIVATSVMTALLASLVVTGLLYRKSVNARNVQWARDMALPEIIKLAEQQDYRAAFSLAKRAERYIPDNPTIAELWPHICRDYSVITEPNGAQIWSREYSALDESWEYLGQTPLNHITLPQGPYRWKIEKEGFVTHECVVEESLDVHLQPKEPTGEMVWIAALYNENGKIKTPKFLIDKYEVTNRQFQAFVDAGGYENADYWEGLEFVKDGYRLSWQEAMVEFRDRTGQPGPATWERGIYPEGQGEYPVSGVSWFEAAAYARFVGKSLPTVRHWERAACMEESFVIVPFSNFDIEGVAPVGSHSGMGRTGLYDMAGNVREWCFNATDDSGKFRYIMGGSWGEPTYMFTHKDAQSPWHRSAQNGFRCVRFPQGNESIIHELRQSLPLPVWRDISDLEPFSDEEFNSYRDMYQYDPTPLYPSVERVDSSSPFWRKRNTWPLACRPSLSMCPSPDHTLPRLVLSPSQRLRLQ
ncbi:SUMF1/EgtB/PvdO family nonheme iron enzyme [Planctomycetota bacterium]